MASYVFSRIIPATSRQCQAQRLLPALKSLSVTQHRQMTHYPIDDIISGLTEEQIQVCYFNALMEKH